MSDQVSEHPTAARDDTPGLWSGRLAGGITLIIVLWYVITIVGMLFYENFDVGRALVGVAAFSSAGIVGGFGGFLFGVPRGGSDSRPSGTSESHNFRPNTNLEQVSDWLTKTIIGVGLVQFKDIGAAVYEVGKSVGSAIGDVPGAPGSGTVLAVVLIVGHTVGVFVLGYMWTTTRLYEIFRTAK